jgi:glutathione S-transferase
VKLHEGGRDVIRLLGRQTSGNVQKVIFCLEELGVPYIREDYGRQFGNTLTDEYRKLNPNAKVPTLIDGDLMIWESHTILRYLAAVHGPALTGATAAERTMVERWMDWLLGALNTPYVAVFKDAKKAPAERAPDFVAQSADLLAQLKILDGHIAGRNWFALDRLTIADMALGAIVKRCLEFPIERPAYSELERWNAAIGTRPAFAVAIGAKPSALTPAA